MLLVILYLLLCTQNVDTHDTRESVYQCGERLTNTRGYITTPNFPKAFQVPIACKWIFHAPPGKKVVLYFTQYYLRELFNVAEYDYYEDETNNAGRYDVGNLRIQEDQIIYLQALKPYMVLNFRVVETANIHIRVGEFLLDVHGFNMTYEVMDIETPVRNDVCAAFRCSYLGRCMVDKDFTHFKCDCFPGYWGDQCQFGYFCNPRIGFNLCQNGGKCRYFMGSRVNTCQCPPAYEGVKCEIKKVDPLAKECEVLGCLHSCDLVEAGGYACTCDEGYKLDTDRRSCKEDGSMRFTSHIRFRDPAADNSSLHCVEDIEYQLRLLVADNFFYNISELSVTYITPYNKSQYFSIRFMADKHLKKEAELFMRWLLSRNQTMCGWHLDPFYLNFSAELALHSMSLVNYDRKPTRLGGLLTLVCSIKGSDKVKFFWFKDGVPINIHMTLRNMWETRVPSGDGQKHNSVLNIQKVVQQDEGTFSCLATDQINEEKKSIQVDIIPALSIEISPLQATVVMGDSLTISCVSHDDGKADFKYEWRKNNKISTDTVEDIAPTGSRLKLDDVQEDANYTCIAEIDQVGSISNTTHIRAIKGTSYCNGDISLGITWTQTGNGISDTQSCPTGTIGHATRKCTCYDASCFWEAPNLTNCTSTEAHSVYEMMMTLELGYGYYSLDETLTAVHNYTEQLNLSDITVLGDLNLMGLILWKLQHYKNLYHLTETQSFPFLKMLTVLDLILNITDNLTEKQKQMIDMMPYLFKVLEYVKDVPLEIYTEVQQEDTFHNIDYAVEKRRIHNMTQPPVHLRLHGITIHSEVPILETLSDSYKMTFISFAYKISSFDNTSLRNDTLFLNSMVAKIGVHKDDPPFMQDVASQFTVRFEHRKTFVQRLAKSQHSVYCALWRFTTFPHGEWDLDECTVVEVSQTSTLCECAWSGVYAVLNRYIQQDNMALQEIKDNTKYAELLFIPIMGFLLYLVFYIVLCMRNKTKTMTSAQPNFYTVMVMLGIALYIGFGKVTDRVICLVNAHAVEVTYLASISSLTTEAVINFLKYGNQKVDHLHPAVHVLCLCGVPVIFAISSTVEYLVKDETKHSHHSQEWCLPVRSDLTFLYCVSIGVLLSVVLLGLQLTVAKLCYKKSKDDLRYQMFVTTRSVSTVFLLNLLMACTVFRDSISLLWTATFILTVLVMIWIPVTPLIDKMEKSMSSTFRAFVRPETMSSLHSSKTDDSDEVFQRDQKYTLDHKALLSSLLGSSSTEESSRNSSLVEFPLLNGRVPGVAFNEKPEKAKCYIQDLDCRY